MLYTNPRGSTGYGEEFAQLIDHNYPSHDYDDLMSGVDAVIKRGYVDENNLFVTGGSGGGVLTAWIVGKTNRFRAAVSCKPVINWYSHALTADMYPFFTQYWFSGPPWERTEEYMKRSPISLVGNVTTPTMLLTGEVDHRMSDLRIGAVLPGAETAQGGHGPGAHLRRIARHRRAAESDDRTGAARAEMVRDASQVTFRPALRRRCQERR